MQARLIAAIVILVCLAASQSFVGWKAYQMGQDNIQVKWDKAVTARVDNKLDVKEKQDEIQNAPIDNAVTVRRLRGGTF